MSDELTVFSELLRAAGPILHEMRDADILRPPTFNIFRVLGREDREVATHSALLAHLLDPQGGHRQGDLFLRLFLNVLGTHETIRGREFPLLAEDGSRWSCRPEVRLPNGYGQVDILVRVAGVSILVENKIYAGDRPNQLYRYWEVRAPIGWIPSSRLPNSIWRFAVAFFPCPTPEERRFVVPRRCGRLPRESLGSAVLPRGHPGDDAARSAGHERDLDC